MAQILDKQGLQHYANKMCNADNRKVGSKSLPTVLNDIDTAIDGFKTLFESEYGSALNMELENNENVFSVGTGVDIDRRDDVENSFTDIEVSGNSLVNLCPETYKFVNAKTSDVVLMDGNDLAWDSDTYRIKAFAPVHPLKPNTTYTIIVNVVSMTNINSISSYVKYPDDVRDYGPFSVSSVGLNVRKFTTTDQQAIELAFYVSDGDWSAEIKGLMLLEGDWTNKPIPQYFKGLKSIGEKEDENHKISISSMGKNLFNMKRVDIRGNAKILNKTYNSVTVTTLQSWAGIQIVNLKLKPNTNYKLKFDRNNDKIKAYIRVRTASGKYSGNANFGGSNDLKFTMPKHSDYIALSIETEVPLENAIISNIQLEENSTATSYEPYKENKKEISLNEPLRGLPNGIRDTIEKINGEWKIVRRCGEIIFDGVTNRITDYHPSWSSGDYHAGYSNALKNIRKKGDTIGIADKIVVTTVEKILAGTNIAQNKGLWLENYSYVVYFSIPKNEATGESINAINTWLTNNNVKLIYQLETPTIEDISPVTLQCWKNGTISIDEVLPVETTHTVALNKSAQIQKNIEELTLLRNRVEALEKQYNNSTLNQAYELELLRFDMELYNIV